MATNYSTSLRLALPVTGEMNGTWGDVVNNQITSMVEQAVAGYQSIAITGDTTLSVANGTTDQSRNMMLKFTGTLAAGANIVVPTATKLYFIDNATTGGFAVTVKTSAGTGIAVPAGYKAVVYCNGTNVVDAVTALSALAVAGNTVLTGTLAVTGAVSGVGFNSLFASPPAIGGTAPAGGAFTTLSASSTVSGAGFSTYLASPPAIGGTAPAAGAFTTLSASGTVSGAGFSAYLASPPAIGGTAPAAGAFTILSASGTLTAAGDVSLTGASSGAVKSVTNPMTFYTSGSERMRIDTSGNVGVGTTPSAGSNLHVYQTGGDGVAEVKIQAAGVCNPRLVFAADASYASQVFFPYDFVFYGAAGSSERMRIDSTGKVDVAVRATNTPLADNDLSFDMAVKNNFTCTPTAGGTLAFTNITAGQSGNILLVNGANYAIAKSSYIKVSSSFLATVSATGTYFVTYYSPDGTNVYMTCSGALS